MYLVIYAVFRWSAAALHLVVLVTGAAAVGVGKCEMSAHTTD